MRQSAFSTLLCEVLATLLIGCSGGANPNANSLVQQGNNLWRSGEQDVAIFKYSDIFRINPKNPYGNFGLGMELATHQVGTPQQRLMIVRAALQFYLDSSADRGTGTEAERRSAAAHMIDSVVKQLAIAEEANDDYNVHDGLRRFKRGQKWGFEDTKRRVVIPPVFDFARSFQNGLAPVKEGEKWGYITPDGKFKIAPQFADAGVFDFGLAHITRFGEQTNAPTFIDANGNYRDLYADSEQPCEMPNVPKFNRMIAGTFRNERPEDSAITIAFWGNGTFKQSQGGRDARGRYDLLPIPHPENGQGDVLLPASYN